MPKLVNNFNYSNIEQTGDMARFLTISGGELFDTINGNLEFGQNIRTSLVTVNFTAANTQVQVTHGLGRVPQGYFFAGGNAAATIYDGTITNTDTFLYVKSSAIANVRILVF
jgi:hypothetical protein